ncbi:MAG: hypothetical protein GF405_09135 [Candidatus Eisenbacteria bacterium]|nr:hypothetical protein [Candidatus Eisenbacteria bacterium]
MMGRHIVKYSNRRLYDPTGGRQITLVDLSDLVLSGEDVTVEQKDTGADITAVTVLQSVIERIRKRSCRDRLETRRLLDAVRRAIDRRSIDGVETTEPEKVEV